MMKKLINLLTNWNTWINSGLVILSTFFAFFLVEFFFQITHLDVPNRVESAQLNGLIIPGYPDFYHFIPGNRTFAVSSTCEFGHMYEINDLGMRDRPHSLKKDGERYRILFIGDSFTEGVGVPQNNTYPYLIQNYKVGQWECINAGMRGTCPSHAYFRLKKFIDRGLEFDFVVLQLFRNDFRDDQNYTKQFELTIPEEKDKILRAPFHECIGEKFQWFGPLAYPLSRLRIFWFFGKFVMGGPPMEPYQIITSPEKAQQIIEIFSRSNVHLHQKQLEKEKVHLTFPLLSKEILSQEGQNELWKFWKTPKINPNILDRYMNAHKKLNTYTPSEKAQQSLNYLDVFNTLCNKHDIPFAIYCPPILSPRNQYSFVIPIEYWCQKNNVNFFYPLEELYQECLNSDEVVYHSFDGHMASKGHQIVAETMIPWLEDIVQN